MALEIEQALESWFASGRRCVGQILIERSANDLFVLCHRDDAGSGSLIVSRHANGAADIAKFDDAGKYRPLKTAPNLRHGWRMELPDTTELRLALDLFYPGRLAVLLVFEQKKLRTTPLRQTLERQSGMYRVAARIPDAQIDDLVGNFCRSDGGCLRTILWKRDATGTLASTVLPAEKFDVAYDQAAGPRAARVAIPVIPLLCQEACNLLISAARDVVKIKS
jgi:sirohydrochlorin cobaltochelatase